MTDRRRRRAAPSEDASREENPFAAPPEGQPDQPWQPRHSGAGTQGPGTQPGRDAGGTDGSDGSADGDSGNGSGSGNGDNGDGGSGDRNGGDGTGRGRSPWGGRWSSQQPGRQSGGFGGTGFSGGPENGNGGPGGSGSGGPGGSLSRGMRWDPTDPTQRHARYSLHTGVWALFFSLFSLPEVALLLGALSVYWGISALRGGKSSSESGSSGRRGGSGTSATAEDVAGSDRTSAAGEQERQPAAQIPVVVTPAQAAKSRTTAAVSGLVTAALALAVVAATFTFQQVYSDYFTCTEDALTQSSREDCKDLLPPELRPLLQDRSSSAAGLSLR